MIHFSLFMAGVYILGELEIRARALGGHIVMTALAGQGSAVGGIGLIEYFALPTGTLGDC